MILNDGQFPVSAGCSRPAEQCFPFQNAFSTTDPTDLNGLVPSTLSGGAGETLSFGTAIYSYSGGKLGGHSGTCKVLPCDTATVPSPGTSVLVRFPLTGLVAVRVRRRSLH
jgi:hypothetical protein